MSEAAKAKVLNALMPKKHLSKKELEDQRKKDEEVAAAKAYEEFVAIFEEPAKHGKAFVRGTTFNAGTREEKLSKETGKLYKPTSKLAELASTFTSVRKLEPPLETKEEARDRLERLKKKGEKEKKKSNLELFKEELKIIQEEREERHRLKTQLKEPLAKPTRFEPIEPISTDLDDLKLACYSGSFDTGDPTTTNLYLGNINPKMTEQKLCEVFGKFGPLASVKVMWPRSVEEKARGRNCGFVAYMNRKDGERAMKSLNGKDIMNYEMKLGWGKAVPIPPHPVYIPPALVELTLPPPPSGLPFNAQPDPKDKDLIKIPPSGTPFTAEEMEKVEFEKLLMNAVVKVVIPTERNLLCLIHRMIEFVVREGPLFEAMIMNRELSNPVFRFLFENQSPAHVYYRWKLFSILQGDSPIKWRTEEFRMFRGGSLWRPPPMNPYCQGMPDELVPEDTDDEEDKQKKQKVQQQIQLQQQQQTLLNNKKGDLSNSQRDRLEEMLRNLTPERSKIADAMVYCIEHAEAAVEIVDCISESLTIFHTPLNKKVARLYLVSDILHNCSVKIANASYYRKGIQVKLPDIFASMREVHLAIEGRLKAEQFKQKIMGCFRTWEDWAIYPNDFLIKMQNLFLGLTAPECSSPKQSESSVSIKTKTPVVDDIDGVPLTDMVDLDGVPLNDAEADMDGEPRNTNTAPRTPQQKISKRESSPSVPKYAPSKWETVDPEIIEAQAMTTSKWDLLDQQDEDDDHDAKQDNENDEDVDGQPMEEEEQVEYEDEEEEDGSNSGGGGGSGYGGNGDERMQESRETRDASSVYDVDVYKVAEERRAKLREIELKVTKFQDELESGRRSRKTEMTLAKQVEHYRQKLLRREHDLELRRISADDSSSGSAAAHVERKRSKLSCSPPPSPPNSLPPPPSSRNQLYARSPKIGRKSRSRSPPPPPPHRTRSKRARSPKKASHRSRSRSPRRGSLHSTPSLASQVSRRRRSSSRSPSRRSHKSRKSKR